MTFRENIRIGTQGRGTLAGRTKKMRIVAGFEQADFAFLRRLAKHRQIGVGTLIRNIVTEYLERAGR